MQYRHTQTAYQTVIFVTVPVAVLLLFVGGLDDGPWAVLANSIVLLLTAGILTLFARLTTTVESGRVAVAFGWGWPVHTENVAEIEAVRLVRNSSWHGWGMRRTPSGWMYNVWGLDAVEIDLSSGKSFRIGTDDPQGLYAALTLAIGNRPQE